MNIIISGYSERKAKNIRAKVEKYLKLLRIHSKLKNHTICIKGSDEISDDYGCFYVPISRREESKISSCHEITLYKQNIKSSYMFLRTIFHELVHLRQYVKGQLVWYRFSCNSYLKAVWKKKLVGKVCEIDHWDQPWEIEAHALEDRFWKEGKL